MQFFRIITCIALLLVSSPTAFAGASIINKIDRILSYSGHTGILLVMKEPHRNPDGCVYSTYYIYPDSSPRAAFVQSMLLSAQASHATVEIAIDGCYENYPRVVHVQIDS
jgi:hypothetical protein